MFNSQSRREFFQTAIAAGLATGLATLDDAHGAEDASERLDRKRDVLRSNLVINDDGENFLRINDDLNKTDLQRYLESYCRGGVGAVAYNAGDMSSPTFYPTQVGIHYADARENQPLSQKQPLWRAKNDLITTHSKAMAFICPCQDDEANGILLGHLPRNREEARNYPSGRSPTVCNFYLPNRGVSP